MTIPKNVGGYRTDKVFLIIEHKFGDRRSYCSRSAGSCTTSVGLELRVELHALERL